MITVFTWTSLRFGKHEWKTLPQVILKVPGYVYWGLGKGIFRGSQDEEADEIARKSCCIKIPKADPENWRVHYKFPPDRNLLDFSIVDIKTAASLSSNSAISTHLDLSLPQILKVRNNKQIGYELMLEKITHYYFGGRKPTKEDCERFFYDDRNFLTD